MMINSDIKTNGIQNLFRNLQIDPKSIFYAIENLSRTILNKARKSAYDKDKVFVNLYDQLEDKNIYKNNNLLLDKSFVNKRSNIDHSTLYSIRKPFELLHADIVDLRFLAKLVVDPKYCLFAVDLLTSKIYVYPMKNRSLLAKKLKLFYEDIKQKRTVGMRLQTDLEFKQNQTKKLNDEFDIKCFTQNCVGGRCLLQNKKLESLKRYC